MGHLFCCGFAVANVRLRCYNVHIRGRPPNMKGVYIEERKQEGEPKCDPSQVRKTVLHRCNGRYG